MWGTNAMSKSTSATNTKSVQDAIKSLTRFAKEVENIPAEEMEKAAKNIKAKAVALTPYRTGKLERSVYVRVSKDKKRPGIRAGASARSRKYNYAGIQHENEEFQHPIKGEAHFISKPFQQEVKNLKQRIKRRLKVKHGS